MITRKNNFCMFVFNPFSSYDLKTLNRFFIYSGLPNKRPNQRYMTCFFCYQILSQVLKGRGPHVATPIIMTQNYEQFFLIND